MSEPWEDYQDNETKPWEDYKQTTQPKQPKKDLYSLWGATITPQMEKSNPYLSATAKTLQEGFGTPLLHFLNQAGLNYPRYMAQQQGISYPEPTTMPGQVLAKGAGVAGAAISPITRAIAGLFGVGQASSQAAGLGEKMLRGAGAGAAIGGAYAQPMKQRPLSALGGAVVGMAIPLVEVGAGISKLKQNIVNIRKSPQIALDAAENTFNGANKIRSSIQDEYSVFRDATKETKIDVKELQSTIDDMFPKPKKIAVGEIPQPPETKLIIPDELKQELKNIFLDENVNLGTVYNTKDAISKHIKPTTWTNFQLGKQVTPEQEHLVKAYFKLDKFIDSSLEKSGMVEEKQILDYLNQKATDLYGMSRKLKSMVYDTTLKSPTKTSKLLNVFMGDIDKQAGDRLLFQRASELEPTLNDVFEKMQFLKGIRQTKSMLKWAGITGATMGAIGVGGKFAGEATKKILQLEQ